MNSRKVLLMLKMRLVWLHDQHDFAVVYAIPLSYNKC